MFDTKPLQQLDPTWHVRQGHDGGSGPENRKGVWLEGDHDGWALEPPSHIDKTFDQHCMTPMDSIKIPYRDHTATTGLGHRRKVT
jgi:hypothetical protein